MKPNENQKPTFPEMVYQILEDSAREGTENIVAWDDNGTSFHIQKPREFNDAILPRYSRKKTKFRSFQRQLNIYGFKMTKKSGTYRHELFRRGDFRAIFQIRPRSTLKRKTNDRDENDDEVKSSGCGSSSSSSNMPLTPSLVHSDDEGQRSTLMNPPLLRRISLEEVEPIVGRISSSCSDEDAGDPIPFGCALHVATFGENHSICSMVPEVVTFDLFDVDIEGISYCTCSGCGRCFD